MFLKNSLPPSIRKFFRFIQCFDNWNSYIIFKLFSREKGFTFHVRRSLKIRLEKTHIAEFLDIFLNERFTGSFKKAMESSPEPMILDIGAGEGYFSLYVLSLFPRARVFSFEQSSSTFETLHRLWSAYNHSSFSVYNYRVCKNDGLFVESQGYSKTLFVKSFKLSTLRKKYQLKHIDLLKLSCAGNEYEILYHLPAQEFQTIDQIVMDVYDIDKISKNTDNMIAFLTENGYQVSNKRLPGFQNKSMIWATRKQETSAKTLKRSQNAGQHF